ncbi:hypothetical protein PG5_55920 [Pseudomonas sp. G5(2012)]|jgi:hypothetical protein|nr:hypothetical protein PG5_55920 [Pseudomonas sp. G5(2012)]
MKSQSEAPQQHSMLICAHQWLSEPRTKLCLFACVAPLQKTISNAASTAV